MVKERWGASGSLGLLTKIATYRDYLLHWGGETAQNFNEEISELKKQLRKLKPQNDEVSLAEYTCLYHKLQFLLDQKDAFWKQQHWLRHGDSHTNYFLSMLQIEERIMLLISFVMETNFSKVHCNISEEQNANLIHPFLLEESSKHFLSCFEPHLQTLTE